MAYRIIDIQKFIKMDFPPREAMLGDWLLCGSLNMIHAKRGIGKSFFSLSIASAIASGGDFLEWKASKQRKVLYIDGEMNAQHLQERCLKLIPNFGEVGSNLFIITPDIQKPAGATPNLYETEDQEMIKKQLNDIDLIIVDNLSCLVRGSKENDADSWTVVQDWLLRLKAMGKTVLLIHHDGKNETQRGTSKREDVLDCVIHLKQIQDETESGTFSVTFTKARHLKAQEAFKVNLLTKDDGDYYWECQPLVKSMLQQVMDLVNDGLRQNQIVEKLSLSKGYVSKLVQEAKNKGLIKAN